MKIAVCVKEVPDAGPNRRMDPGTKRMDRSGDRSLNQYDLHAVEQALRLKEAAGDGEVVLVSMGASRALDSLRKGLGMGADRAVLVSDEAAAGSDLVATTNVLAAALEAESPDLVLFGQQATDGDGAVLWAAVADQLKMPVISQISELEVADGHANAKRQTEFGYDTIRAPLPVVLAVADSLNEPRYPSLKGIMGAKKKPQETKSLADVGVDAGEAGEAGSRTTVIGLADAPVAWRHDQDRGRRQRRPEDHRLPHGKEAGMSTLVFLEHHGSSIQRGALGVLGKAAQIDPETAGVIVGSGVREVAAGAGRYGAKRVFVADDAALEAPLPQPRVDVISKLVGEGGFDTVLFAASVLASDVAGGLSPPGSARASTGTSPTWSATTARWSACARPWATR